MGGREGWRDAPAGGARNKGHRGGRARVGGVGRDWWDGSYWGGEIFRNESESCEIR